MSAQRGAAATLPRLAYVYHPLSFAPLSITDAAHGICSLIWVVDGTQPGAATIARLLRKFGPVVDVAGLTLDQSAARVGEQAPDGVLSMHDSDLLWTAQLAGRLGLSFHSVPTAETLTDKQAQREALRAAGLATPELRVIAAGTRPESVAELTDGFAFPGVLKPRRGQASRDTLPVASAAALGRILLELGGEDATHEDFVLEGYVPDSEAELGGGPGVANFVSVESIVEHGRIAHAAVSARTRFLWPFRETGYFTPSALSDELRRDVLAVATDATRALDVRLGCLHTEIKLTDDGPVVIEVNGRPGGGMSEMLERASGFSLLRAALRLAVGDPVALRVPVACERVGYLLYVFPGGSDAPTVVESVEGLSELGRLEGVEEVVLVRGPGSRIDWREGSEAHVFHYAGSVPSHRALRELMAQAERLVTIVSSAAPPPAQTATS